MTDQIPADKVREILATGGLWPSEMIAEIEALLPPPPHPTLADMSVEERRACEWMQCDAAGLDGEWLIIDPFDDEDHAHVIGRRGNGRVLPAHFITPRPDLPRMEWTGSKRVVPDLPDGWRLAEHQTRGPVIVTRPEPDDDGEVCYVAPAVGFLGYVCCFCDPDELTYIDTEPAADQ